jgi:signal transduction histidine kinase
MTTSAPDENVKVRGLRLSESGESLEEAFSRAKQEVAPDEAIAFRVIVAGQARPLYPLIRDEIHRIGREALINAFRHSGARNIEIEIEIEYHDERMTVHVRDDGRGIDTTRLEAVTEHHWGLSGMHERAREIGAKLTVRSRIAAGTEIELSVPRRIAYQQVPPRHLTKSLRHFLAGWRTGRNSSAD